MIRQQLFIGAALIVGVAIGFFVQPEPEKPEASDPKAEKASAPIPDRGNAAVVESLRARIRDLERRLSDVRREEESLVSNALVRLDEKRVTHPPQQGSRNNWLEELKKNDPARFTQMTNRFAQWRQERKARHAAHADFLSSVNTAHMSAAAKKTHEAYQDLLGRREALEARLQNPDLTDEERRSLFEEMRAVSHEMRGKGAEERENLLGEVAHAIGLEGEAAAELVETVKDVIEVTEPGFGGREHRGPPPGDRR